MHEFLFPTFPDPTDRAFSIRESNNPVQDIWISSDYFTVHFATLKDSWPVKTNLSISNNLSTFSHAVSNFFIMDGIRTANAFTIICGHHFTSHLYFVSHTGSTLHLISTVIILEMFPSEKIHWSSLILFLESPCQLFMPKFYEFSFLDTASIASRDLPYAFW